MISFPYPGGKARIVKQIIKYIPEEGDTYLEPFVGRGNVFFNIMSSISFSRYHINDSATYQFFRSLRDADLSQLPPTVSDIDFDVWVSRALADHPIAHIIEPKITFKGKGYASGYQDSRYNRQRYTRICERARSLLLDPRVRVSGYNYIHLDWDRYTEDDFVYLDPPYYNTSGVGYGNIDHEHLLHLLTDASFRWLLSGYQNDLYAAWLGEPVAAFERNLEMSAARGGTVTECLWSNNG